MNDRERDPVYYQLCRLDRGKEMAAWGRRIEEIWQDAEGVMHRRDIEWCPQIGRVLRIAFIDTYCELTWWATTPVQEILEDHSDRLVFRTQKSTYELSIRRWEEGHEADQMSRYTDALTAREVMEFVSVDVIELSYAKVRAQRDEWQRTCRGWLVANPDDDRGGLRRIIERIAADPAVEGRATAQRDRWRRWCAQSLGAYPVPDLEPRGEA